MLNSVNNEYMLKEQMVHYVGGHVMPKHSMACKATLVFHAGATVASR
jgi:predicted RNA binding protein YcfA (HicA-like mRNA interferase family)